MTSLSGCTLPGDIDIRFSTVPSSIVQDADGVDVTLTSPVDGSTTTERLRALAGVHRVELPADPGPDAKIVLTYQEVQDGLDRLQALGFPIQRSREAGRHFRGWRVNYEPAAYLLADRLRAAPGALVG